MKNSWKGKNVVIYWFQARKSEITEWAEDAIKCVLTKLRHIRCAVSLWLSFWLHWTIDCITQLTIRFAVKCVLTPRWLNWTQQKKSKTVAVGSEYWMWEMSKILPADCNRRAHMPPPIVSHNFFPLHFDCFLQRWKCEHWICRNHPHQTIFLLSH